MDLGLGTRVYILALKSGLLVYHGPNSSLTRLHPYVKMMVLKGCRVVEIMLAHEISQKLIFMIWYMHEHSCIFRGKIWLGTDCKKMRFENLVVEHTSMHACDKG